MKDYARAYKYFTSPSETNKRSEIFYECLIVALDIGKRREWGLLYVGKEGEGGREREEGKEKEGGRERGRKRGKEGERGWEKNE